MDEDILIQRLNAYASRHQLHLVEQLGSGIHGIVFTAGRNPEAGETALKIHKLGEPYQQELAVYERLREHGIRRILEFNVPRLLRNDDELLVLEMDLVARPFVLDFAGVHLDFPPEFPEEVWQEWEADRKERFEERWPKVREVLAALEELGIYMTDASPGNIGFA